MDGRSTRVRILCVCRQWAKCTAVTTACGGLLALIGLVTPSRFLPYSLILVAGLSGMFIAVSVLKFGSMGKKHSNILFTTSVSATLCLISSAWAGICQFLLCSLANHFLDVMPLSVCNVNVTRATVFSGVLISPLLGLAIPLTLGRAGTTDE